MAPPMAIMVMCLAFRPRCKSSAPSISTSSLEGSWDEDFGTFSFPKPPPRDRGDASEDEVILRSMIVLVPSTAERRRKKLVGTI